MTKRTLYIVLGASVLSLAAVAALAQGPGGGSTGWQCPYGYAPRGMGGYGWQARVSQVGDPALAAEITEVHQLIRQKQWDLRALQAQGEDTSALQAEIGSLRNRLQSLNERAGLCTGTGPHAFGLNGQRGVGWGVQQGYCPRLGNGYGRGAGRGMGYGRGAGFGMGYGLR